jgi:xanthine dehydrogenase YagT iron-sulfur-binding subunit
MPTLVPLCVGAVAPEISLSTYDSTRLADYRGSPVVLVIDSSHWDPTRDEITARLAEWPDLPDGVQVVHASSAQVSAAFGTGDNDAAFVIDEDGVIRWRYVSGIDALSKTVNWSRREFLQAAIVFAAALALTRQAHPVAQAWAAEPKRSTGISSVKLRVNGRDLSLQLEPRVTLLDALRNYAGLTGTKKGCDHGQCGACTVHIDGRRVLSCMTFAIMQQSHEITTIEGLANGEALHPMQQAFITHDGFQCGYCTSGQIMSATAMVKEPWGAADNDVREAMSGNICRCGAYPGIVAAVQSVRGNSAGKSDD